MVYGLEFFCNATIILFGVPEIFTCFVFEVCPPIISTELFEMPKVFARSFSNSAFAAPSIGGDAIRIFNAPSNSPTISLFEARGTTRTVKIIALSFSVKFINSQ